MDNKIKEMAEKLAKSYEENENLKEFKQLAEELGKEGVKEVIKSLPEDSQTAFVEALEKAMSVSNESSEVGPEAKQEVSEDARASDKKIKKEQEKSKGEELVDDEEAAKIKHQGDNSVQAGEVIKSEEEETDLEKGAVKELAIEEDEKALAFEELEKGELLEKMIEKMRKRGMDHDIVMAALKKKGYDTEMAKGKWADMEEMEQESMAKKEAAEKQEVKKSEETPVEETVQKSVQWASDNERLEVNAKRGHNTHYDVDAYLVKSALDKAAGPQETLEKSEETSEVKSINDVIEKGYDRSMDQVKQAVGHVQKSTGGDYNTQSFSDEDLAKSMQMTVEQMHEVLGTTPAPVKEDEGKKS